MIFTPHNLQRNIAGAPTKDEFGNPVPAPAEWQDVSPCRYDDNATHENVSVGGVMYEYKYHIVYSGGGVKASEHVRAVDTESGEIRGEGSVIKSSGCNYFNYAEVWI